jgi:hypothetical protein
MTVRRPETYLQRALASMSLEQPVALLVGSPDTSYLAPLQSRPGLHVVAPSPVEYGAIAPLSTHQRAAWNYWRCLRHGLGNRYLLVLEDDVRCANGWEERLVLTVLTIAAIFPDFVLSLYFPYPRQSVGGACYLPYPKKEFYGTQAILFAGRALPEFTAHLHEHGVRSCTAPYDLLLQDYVLRRDVPLFASAPSLVQHIGVVTTGLSAQFHTTPWFVEDIADWRP